MIEQPKMVKIYDIREETPGVKTFFFEADFEFKPGQFIMVWIPDLDEKPFTISYMHRSLIGISVLKIGLFTHALHRKKTGQTIGIRGPYGRGFNIETQANPCIVGGGIGLASLATLADRLPGVTIIHGARNADEILYRERFKEMKICTDDGTLGFKGTAVDLLEEMLKEQHFHKVYTCGPEEMMYKVVEICKRHSMDCEVSLDRYFKCAIGICGQCDCSGQRVCVEGPVFSVTELDKMDDFGKTTLLKTGKRIRFQDKY